MLGFPIYILLRIEAMGFSNLYYFCCSIKFYGLQGNSISDMVALCYGGLSALSFGVAVGFSSQGPPVMRYPLTSK